MTEPERKGLEGRLLILAPTGKDAELTQDILARAGVDCVGRDSLPSICAELQEGAGALLLAEEAVDSDRDSCLDGWLAAQQPWSDLPILILARPGADSARVAQSMDLFGNVTVLERPMRVAALVSAVRTALRARARQYQIREQLTSLREAGRRKDEFLAILAHELRNPLAPIRNSLQILRLTGSRSPEAESLGEIMERQVNHMVRLVDDLMEVSRITRSKIVLRKEPVEAAAMVRSALETSRPLLDEAGHELIVSIPPEPLALDGDPVRLTQIVSNLLNNAAKYTDGAGTVWLTVRREGDEAAISVRDTGTGIASEMLPRVFDPFTQGARHTEQARGGLGIGLTLVKSLVELHGGQVEAFSEGAGLGSEFVVHLPLSKASPASAEPQGKPGPNPALAAHRVLVVDDNRDAAEGLGLLLRLLGADVQVTFSGPEALARIQGYHPSAVFLDIGMPGMDGHEVARRIRLQPDLEGVLLIALTGWGMAEDRRRSRMAGFDHHLVKPAELGALESLLAAAAPSARAM